MKPKIDQKSTSQPDGPPRAAQRPPGSHFGTILEPFWIHFGTHFGTRFGPGFGPGFGPVLVPFWVRFRPIFCSN